MNNGEPLEIERKYLIRYPDPGLLDKICAGKADMHQVYLGSEAGVSRRIRKVETAGRVEYWYNEKTRLSDTTRIERERIIREDEYNALLKEADADCSIIRKTRHYLYYGQFCFEIDVFPEWNDRAIMEVELENENADITFPDSIEIIKEVTSDRRYTNASLARNGFIYDQLSDEAHL